MAGFFVKALSIRPFIRTLREVCHLRLVLQLPQVILVILLRLVPQLLQLPQVPQVILLLLVRPVPHVLLLILVIHMLLVQQIMNYGFRITSYELSSHYLFNLTTFKPSNITTLLT